MITANLMRAVSAKNMNTQTSASKKLQEENQQAAELFAGLMNQAMDFSSPVIDGAAGNMDISKASAASSSAESYERYSYKDNQIDIAKQSGLSEKLEKSGETLEQAEQDVVDTICEEYGVDEETVQKLLDEMGLSPLDLLNPQNLVSFLAGLTGASSGEELLLDENFLKVMESLNHLAEDLMKELDVDMDGLQSLVDEMEVVEEQDIVAENVFESPVDTGGRNTEGDSLLNQNADVNQTVIVNSNVANQVADVSQVPFTSYLSADTVRIMEQITKQIHVNVTPQTTSMDMQLNPENLGKVYVHISSEEGVVNAQFHATNEVVKEVLEAQIATLRENLNQAGVKVDAIEVTIASHEFERNLEQNQSQNQSEEQIAGKESASSKRRNITLDSLDELSGLMTEEETLVAQMMKDNGNSVDFTA